MAVKLENLEAWLNRTLGEPNEDQVAEREELQQYIRSDIDEAEEDLKAEKVLALASNSIVLYANLLIVFEKKPDRQYAYFCRLLVLIIQAEEMKMPLHRIEAALKKVPEGLMPKLLKYRRENTI